MFETGIEPETYPLLEGCSIYGIVGKGQCLLQQKILSKFNFQNYLKIKYENEDIF